MLLSWFYMIDLSYLQNYKFSLCIFYWVEMMWCCWKTDASSSTKSWLLIQYEIIILDFLWYDANEAETLIWIIELLAIRLRSIWCRNWVFQQLFPSYTFVLLLTSFHLILFCTFLHIILSWNCKKKKNRSKQCQFIMMWQIQENIFKTYQASSIYMKSKKKKFDSIWSNSNMYFHFGGMNRDVIKWNDIFRERARRTKCFVVDFFLLLLLVHTMKPSSISIVFTTLEIIPVAPLWKVASVMK